jgi:uncharacterized membrane protein (DUF373 family)
VNRFDIHFDGELAPGATPQAVRDGLKSRLKLSEPVLDRLMDGVPKIIARDLDIAAAARFEAAFVAAGARLRIVPSEPVSADAVRPETPESHRAEMLQEGLIARAFHYFERTLAAVLLVLMSGVAILAVAELCFVLYKDLTSDKGLFLDLSELFEVFGMFLIVLIAIELMASVYMYMMDKSVHVEIMLLIAVTALTRKVVVLDTESKGDPAMYMLGLAALLGTLVVGYYLVKRLGGNGDGH